jgi:SAM-dependent methyltransferase
MIWQPEYSVTPSDLPKVKEQHHPAIFGDITDIVNSRIRELESLRQPYPIHARNLLHHFLDTVDADAFNGLKDVYLRPGHSILRTDLLKYLDVVYWLEGKLRTIIKLGLHQAPPMTILDIGTGPGYFPFAAQYFGHDLLGTDIPLSDKQVEEPIHLYDRLCELLSVEKVVDKIVPFEQCSDFGGRFDLVTAFMAAFNVFSDRTPWSIEAWEFFLHSLGTSVLKESGNVYLNLTNGKVTDEVWGHLASLAEWSDENRRELFFCNPLRSQT